MIFEGSLLLILPNNFDYIMHIYIYTHTRFPLFVFMLYTNETRHTWELTICFHLLSKMSFIPPLQSLSSSYFGAIDRDS